MSDTPKAGDLATTLATWLYYLDQHGHRPKDDELKAALDQVSRVSRLEAMMLTAAEQQNYAEAAEIQSQIRAPGADPDALGQALVSAVEASLSGDSSDAVTAWAQDQLGVDNVLDLRKIFPSQNGDFRVNRQNRVLFTRQSGFHTGLPWIAQIIDRFPDGSVGAHWVMVERVTDHVRCMDPYPWDDLDEEVEIPLVEFMVKWELAGCTGLHWS